MKKNDNFSIAENSPIKFSDILHWVYIIEQQEDYFEYLKMSKRDFKVVWALSNTIVSLSATEHIDILVCNNTKEPKIYFLENGYVIVSSDSSLSRVCSQLLAKWYDCTYLLWIPGTIGGAVVNNSWSGILKKSIFDNIVQVEYYFRDIKYQKFAKDILFSFRNTEFKCGYNIFITQVVLKFHKMNSLALSHKIQERRTSRSKLKDIYACPSLWTFYIGNRKLDYQDIISEKLCIINNKIVNCGSNSTYQDYCEFKKKINQTYELEVEEITEPSGADYVWVLIVDRENNFLLQKRDTGAPKNKGMITLFGWKREKEESIRWALRREIREELDLDIGENLAYLGLFLKNNERCFIFCKEVENINDFCNTISCYEWNKYIAYIADIKHIQFESKFTETLKKVLAYYI